MDSSLECGTQRCEELRAYFCFLSLHAYHVLHYAQLEWPTALLWTLPLPGSDPL